MITDIDLALACQDCYDNPQIRSHDVECSIEQRGDALVLAFRGTTDVDDMRNNIFFIPWPNSDIGWAHAGFLRPLLRALPKIMGKLDKEKLIYVAGHSKGGAEALLAARLLQARGYRIVCCVTFGAPKTLMKNSVKSFSKLPVRQYRNGGDPVPLVPRGWIFDYAHASELKHIGDNNWLSVNDHHIGQYIYSLGNING